MCRHIALVGRAPVALARPLFGEGQSLARQTYAPAHQAVGRGNADGWGVGWWDRTIRPEPARYRTVTPMWADLRFREIAPLIRTSALVAAARNASAGAPVEESGNAPFADGPWLFSFNGYVEGFRHGIGTELRREVSERRDRGILGSSDAEVLFALLLDRLDAGAPPADAVATLVGELDSRAGGRFNLLLSDGATVVATRCRNELFTRSDPGVGSWVASEPLDGGAWHEEPDGTVVVATADEVRRLPL